MYKTTEDRVSPHQAAVVKLGIVIIKKKPSLWKQNSFLAPKTFKVVPLNRSLVSGLWFTLPQVYLRQMSKVIFSFSLRFLYHTDLTWNKVGAGAKTHLSVYLCQEHTDYNILWFDVCRSRGRTFLLRAVENRKTNGEPLKSIFNSSSPRPNSYSVNITQSLCRFKKWDETSENCCL